MVKTYLAYTFKYKRSIDCWLSFTSTDETEPLRICRLDQILEGRIEFKKSSISYEEIFADARKKGIIPMMLILKDGTGNILKQIELGEASKEENWFLTRSQFSEIQYVHEYTKPAISPRISVKNFLSRGI